MKSFVKIGDKLVGENQQCFVIAEIGINHNGSVEHAKKLIDIAVSAGCDAVKFQKRTVDVVYTKEELAKERITPLGKTNGDLKRGLELGYEQYKELDEYCKIRGILWFASCWDEGSVDFIDKFNPPCYKIASACLTDDNLLKYTRSKGKPIIMSTGMSSMAQIEHAVKVLGEKDLILMHTTSTYPSEQSELNLNVIKTLDKKFGCLIGYSGHERGIAASLMAVTIGAVAVERHITSDRTMWGSDQVASLEPPGIHKLVRDIRQVPIVMGDGVKVVYDTELPIIEKLRRVK